MFVNIIFQGYTLLEVAATGAETLLAVLDRAIKRHKSREDQLVEIVVQGIVFAIDHPDLFRVMFGQVPGGPSHERYNQTLEACFLTVVRVIYGEDRYRVSPLVARRAATGGALRGYAPSSDDHRGCAHAGRARVRVDVRA